MEIWSDHFYCGCFLLQNRWSRNAGWDARMGYENGKTSDISVFTVDLAFCVLLLLQGDSMAEWQKVFFLIFIFFNQPL